MDLYEIRNTTKKLLREGTPTSIKYEKALPLCKELFDAFPETHDLWDENESIDEKMLKDFTEKFISNAEKGTIPL